MIVETLAEALQREHREIDAGLDDFAEGVARGELRLGALHGAMTALRRHIYLEEEFLFPPLREAGLVAPVFVMVREHGQMWHTIDALESELDSRRALDSVSRLCRELGELEDAHNPKEEQILYPQADRVLSPAAGDRLRTFLDSGRIPDGWVCQAARA